MFQLFALSDHIELGASPGRKALVEAIAGHVLGAAILIGSYSRGEPSTSDEARLSGFGDPGAMPA